MVAFNSQPINLGAVTVSVAVAAKLGIDDVRNLLARHAAGDCGEVDAEIRGDNFRATAAGRGPVSSIYRVPAGTVFVVTELERAETSVLFAEEKP